MAAQPAPPRLAGRLTAELILRSPQQFNAVKDYELDLRGAPRRALPRSAQRLRRRVRAGRGRLRRAGRLPRRNPKTPAGALRSPAGHKLGSVENLAVTQARGSAAARAAAARRR